MSLKNKKIVIIIILILLIIILTIFIKNNYKSLKNGNNISNKSADEIKEYILNIESYKAIIKMQIKSNKNENTYIASQTYNKEKNTYIQEVLEPEKISGIKFIYDGNNLKIENTKLSLSKIYEEYKYIESNKLSLISFIEDYKKSNKTKCYEKNGTIYLEIEANNEKKIIYKTLSINKENGKIIKLEIKDMAQDVKIYILYNEIEIN